MWASNRRTLALRSVNRPAFFTSRLLFSDSSISDKPPRPNRKGCRGVRSGFEEALPPLSHASNKNCVVQTVLGDGRNRIVSFRETRAPSMRWEENRMVNHQQTDLINDTSNLKVRIGSAHVYAHVWEGGREGQGEEKSMTHSMASRKNRFLI